MADSATSSRILTIPNLLTIFRMALVPVFVSLLYYQRFFLALLVFAVAGATDGLDGLFARLFDQRSQLGTVLDPVADKLLMTASFVTLSLPAIIPHGLRHLPVPFWVTAAVISRDVFIIIGAAAINIMTGFRAFRPSWLGKASTTIQILGVICILTAASFPWLKGFFLPTVYTIVFAFAIFSGIHYIFFVSRLMNEDRRAAQSGN